MSTVKVTITNQMLREFYVNRRGRIQKWNRYGQAKSHLKGLGVDEYCTLRCPNCKGTFNEGDVAVERKCGETSLYFCGEECYKEWEEKRLKEAKGQMHANVLIRKERKRLR